MPNFIFIAFFAVSGFLFPSEGVAEAAGKAKHCFVLFLAGENMMDAAATECKEGDQLQARVNVKEGRQSYTGVARLICDLRYPVLVENGFSDMPDEESIVLIACIYRDLRK